MVRILFFLKELNAHMTRRRMLMPSQRTEPSQMPRLDLTLTEPWQLAVSVVSKRRSTWSLKGLVGTKKKRLMKYAMVFVSAKSRTPGWLIPA